MFSVFDRYRRYSYTGYHPYNQCSNRIDLASWLLHGCIMYNGGGASPFCLLASIKPIPRTGPLQAWKLGYDLEKGSNYWFNHVTG